MQPFAFRFKEFVNRSQKQQAFDYRTIKPSFDFNKHTSFFNNLHESNYGNSTIDYTASHIDLKTRFQGLWTLRFLLLSLRFSFIKIWHTIHYTKIHYNRTTTIDIKNLIKNAVDIPFIFLLRFQMNQNQTLTFFIIKSNNYPLLIHIPS